MGETNPYIQLLIEGLQKKKKVLDQIILKNQQQIEILSQDMVEFDAFDQNVSDKGELIKTLAVLDEGFESVYERVKVELIGNKEKYRAQIKLLQQLIKEITDKSVSIQTMEARNKKKIEDYFSYTRASIHQAKHVNKVANSYYNTMTGKSIQGESTWDQKK